MNIHIKHNSVVDLYECQLPGLPSFFCYDKEKAHLLAETILTLWLQARHKELAECESRNI